MPASPLALWYQLVAESNPEGLDALLADEVVFHSPVVDTPQAGKEVTRQYLAAAFQVFAGNSFRYVRELAGDRDAVLEFEVEIDGVSVNGVDMIQWDEAGRIVEFKVMLRPLKGLKLVHQKTSALLPALLPG